MALPQGDAAFAGLESYDVPGSGSVFMSNADPASAADSNLTGVSGSGSSSNGNGTESNGENPSANTTTTTTGTGTDLGGIDATIGIGIGTGIGFSHAKRNSINSATSSRSNRSIKSSRSSKGSPSKAAPSNNDSPSIHLNANPTPATTLVSPAAIDATVPVTDPSSAGSFVSQEASWGQFPTNPLLQPGLDSTNAGVFPDLLNSQFLFSQQWPTGTVPQFTGELPQRPRADLQQPQPQQPQPQQPQQQQQPQPQPQPQPQASQPQQQPQQQPDPQLIQQLIQQQQQQQHQELLFRLQQQSAFLQQQAAFAAATGGGFAPANHIRPNFPQEMLSSLTPAQQETLKNIAMPVHLQYHSPRSASSPAGSGAASSPDDANKAANRKRKSSADEEDDDDDDDDDENAQQPVKKTAHNMIEKRYRTNLNDKIAALRDSVPSLRIMTKSARGEDTTEDREELHGLTPAHKLNKATVLSKATEYIRHLEKRNTRLQDENAQMMQRVAAFEKLFMHGVLSGPNAMNPMAQPSTMPFGTANQPDPAAMAAFLGNSASPDTAAAGGSSDPRGMIPVPEEMKRILEAQAAAGGRPYPVPAQPFQAAPAVVRQQQIQQQQQQQQMQQNRWNGAAPYLGKMMVGSLAGLMLLEAVREQESSPEQPQGRGLMAVPLQLLRPLAGMANMHISVGGYYFSGAQIFATAKMLLVCGLLLWAFVPSLFRPTGGAKTAKTQQNDSGSSLQAVPSLASPIHIRRQAWLTAIQTVWVPRHNVLLEAVALVLKTIKLGVRHVFGLHAYQMLSGLTEEQEAERVKAWSIALDAQLAGGDVEINEGRLALTLLASNTLPETPQRLMLDALHVRVLMRQLGKNAAFDVAAAHLARNRWNAARDQNMLASFSFGSSASASASPSNQSSAEGQLPSHLAALLACECDDVLNDEVVQRAHNLAFNRPTAFAIPSGEADMNGASAVVDDPAVRSPLDAVAAWHSSRVLHGVLTASLTTEPTQTTEALDEENEATTPDPAAKAAAAALADALALAARVAPEGSHAQVRALVARAVLVDDKRGGSIAAALQALRPSRNPDKHPAYSHVRPPLIDAPQAPPVGPDREAMIALRCAMALAHLQRWEAPPEDVLASVHAVLQLYKKGGDDNGDANDDDDDDDDDKNAYDSDNSTSTSGGGGGGGNPAVSLLASAAAFRLMLSLHAYRMTSPTSASAAACTGALERLARVVRVWVGGPAGDRGGLAVAVRQTMVRRCLAVTRSIVGMEEAAAAAAAAAPEASGSNSSSSSSSRNSADGHGSSDKPRIDWPAAVVA